MAEDVTRLKYSTEIRSGPPSRKLWRAAVGERSCGFEGEPEGLLEQQEVRMPV